jgi:hypothetical protein
MRLVARLASREGECLLPRLEVLDVVYVSGSLGLGFEDCLHGHACFNFIGFYFAEFVDYSALGIVEFYQGEYDWLLQFGTGDVDVCHCESVNYALCAHVYPVCEFVEAFFAVESRGHVDFVAGFALGAKKSSAFLDFCEEFFACYSQCVDIVCFHVSRPVEHSPRVGYLLCSHF